MSESDWKRRQNKPKPTEAYVEKCFQYAVCAKCGERVAMGDQAVWFERKVWHLACGQQLLGPRQEAWL